MKFIVHFTLIKSLVLYHPLLPLLLLLQTLPTFLDLCQASQSDTQAHVATCAILGDHNESNCNTGIEHKSCSLVYFLRIGLVLQVQGSSLFTVELIAF